MKGVNDGLKDWCDALKQKQCSMKDEEILFIKNLIIMWFMSNGMRNKKEKWNHYSPHNSLSVKWKRHATQLNEISSFPLPSLSPRSIFFQINYNKFICFKNTRRKVDVGRNFVLSNFSYQIFLSILYYRIIIYATQGAPIDETLRVEKIFNTTAKLNDVNRK